MVTATRGNLFQRGIVYAIVCGLAIEVFACILIASGVLSGSMAARHSDVTRVVVTCRLVPDLIRKLDRLGEEDRRSRSELIEMAVREFLEKREKAKAKK